MLIDYTYFQEPISIPNLSDPAVMDSLNRAIATYEPEFLEKLLGRTLYKGLLAGLQAQPIEQRWQDLIFESGLISLPLGVSINLTGGNSIDMEVGRGEEFDPVADATSVIIPPSFVGVPTEFNRRGVGPLTSKEYSITDQLLSLLKPGDKFSNGETYFLKKGFGLGIEANNYTKTSMIANYVYFKYTGDNATHSTGVGEVVAKTDNSTTVSPAPKQIRAWNKMVEKAHEFRKWLNANYFLYPENVYDGYYLSHSTYRGYGVETNEIYVKLNPVIW